MAGNFDSGHQSVDANGTAQRLVAASLKVRSVTFKPQLLSGVANTGDVVLGGTAAGTTIALKPNIIPTMPAFTVQAEDLEGLIDLFEIWINSATDDDGIAFWFVL